MDGLKTQLVGNLGEVQLPLPDHLASGLDFHLTVIVHDTAAGLIVEVLLQLATSDQIIPTDLIQSQGLIQPLFQIGSDLGQPLVQVSGLTLTGRKAVSLANQADQQFFQRSG